MIHEAVVDSFLYENCSTNVNPMTEFCTGVPVVRGYAQVWDWSNDQWIKIGNELRGTSAKTRLRTRQHTSQLGDVCYGDAGGSVWKYWMFRDPNSDSSERGRKLAVLTGVISRFAY